MFVVVYPWHALGDGISVIAGAVGCNESVDKVFEVQQGCDECTRSFLRQHQIISIPAVVVSDVSENSSRIMYPTLAVSESRSRSASNIVGEALEAYNAFDIDLAIKRFEEVIQLDSTNKQALFNLACIMHMIELPTLAVGYITRLLVIDPDDSTAHSFLWALNQAGQCRQSTLGAYTQLSSLGDIRAATKLAVLTGFGTQASKGNPTYAEQIYDEMAEKFESKLVDCLGYRGPWLMLDQLEKLVGKTEAGCLRPKGDWRILDIGCGSGLVGKVFSEYAGERLTTGDSLRMTRSNLELSKVRDTPGPVVIGIDVSARMTEITMATGHYDCAHHADLTVALGHLDCSGAGDGSTLVGMDMVVAADTFIYVGALGSVFALVRKVLRSHADVSGKDNSGGLFMFTTEDLDSSPMQVSVGSCESVDAGASQHIEASEDNTEIPGAVPGWGARLLTSARFAHSDSYIRQLCRMHGFNVLCREKIVLRTEETVPLPGNIYILQKVG